MEAVVIHEAGSPEVLRLEEVDRPEPGDGEVLIRVEAAGVNPVDWKQRSRMSPEDLPAVLGRDISGTVEVSRAEGLSEGDEVFGISAGGGYAEYSTAAAESIAPKPAGLSHAEASALPVAAGTAWEALFDQGGLERGQTAVIAGAAGGVGHFAVQVARHAGARVVGSGGSGNRDFVLGLGAEAYVDYTQEDVGQTVSGADLALDTVGGETTASLLPALREGGILVTIAAQPPEDEAREQGKRAVVFSAMPGREELERIAGLVAGGEVRVEIAEEIPLSEVARAHETSEGGHVRGKLVLSPIA